MKRPFENADPETKVFYSRVFYMIILNLNAVKMGLYDQLLCDMETPGEALRWKATMPKVVHQMRLMGGHRGR